MEYVRQAIYSQQICTFCTGGCIHREYNSRPPVCQLPLNLFQWNMYPRLYSQQISTAPGYILSKNVQLEYRMFSMCIQGEFKTRPLVCQLLLKLFFWNMYPRLYTQWICTAGYILCEYVQQAVFTGKYKTMLPNYQLPLTLSLWNMYARLFSQIIHMYSRLFSQIICTAGCFHREYRTYIFTEVDHKFSHLHSNYSSGICRPGPVFPFPLNLF